MLFEEAAEKGRFVERFRVRALAGASCISNCPATRRPMSTAMAEIPTCQRPIDDALGTKPPLQSSTVRSKEERYAIRR
jgi:hypothetical protein